MEDRERIAEVLQGTNMVFITTGMGGGTGTGAAPIIAEVAKEMGILTVAVVTRPFPFEGRKRMQIADEGIRMLSESVDSLITIPNEKLLTILGKDASLLSAFAKADDVLAGAVRGISDIIKRPGMINVDFADVRTVMSEMGMAMMGTGCASGPNRAREATEAAIRNPLLEDVNLQGARGILVNITAGPDLSLGEYSDVGSIIEAFASEHAMVKVGTVIDPDMRDELHVTVVATGLGAKIEKPVKVIDNTLQTTQQAPAHQAARQEAPSVNYRDLDRPTVMRNQAHASATAAAKMNPNDDLDYLDIPAFLRRQAD
ncbi:cell division protein FtsZ, partial [Pseudomonas syringae]